MGFIAWRRAAAAGRRTRMAGWALGLAGGAIVLQLSLAEAVGGWLLPNLERRTTQAITAACEGRFSAAVPDPESPSLAPAAAAPSPQAIDRFAADLAAAMGSLKSVSVINPEVNGSPLTPRVTMALVAQFEKGSCTVSARVQWVPPPASDPQPWLPTARVLEVEFALPGGRTLRVGPEETPTP